MRPSTEDTYYQEGLAQLMEVTTEVADFCHRHALLLLKPDAVVARKLLSTLDWLADNGFRVVAAERVRLNRHMIRAVWYLQWTTASPQRKRLADLLATAADSLVLVVRAETDSAVPASVRLTNLKGPTDPGDRLPGQLRHLLGNYSYLLNLVHTADEPADVLRELSIYFDTTDLPRILRDAFAGEDLSPRAGALARALYAEFPPRSLDFTEAAAAVLGEVEDLLAQPDLDRAARQDLASAVDLAGPDLRDKLSAVLHWSWQHGVRLDRWNTIIVGASVLPMTRGSNGRRCLVDGKQR